ncbi:MAG: Dihydroorotase [Saprospiraceae bacterium]|nr:Dihydroorotase [Saprospiraceae bacterium]
MGIAEQLLVQILKTMLLLLKNVRIITEKSEGRPQDIFIRDGMIEAIGDELRLEKNADIWEWPGACVSAGWFDAGVQACDPGYEHREDLHSAARAAAAGGFTAVASFPNTNPAIQSKSEVLYVKNKTADSPVTFYPIGAVSQGCEGKDLAELFDMHSAGAVAFSDGRKAVQDAGLLLRALQYAKAFNGLILNEPHHKTIAAGGQMHEGVVSTSLGMKGVPALAEEIMVQRDLSLLEYVQGRLHLHLLSTAKSVALVRAAKKSGLPVTASVAVANLCFTDEKLASFDSNWKVLPPLRSQSDVNALLEGLADGTIDFICSNHTPWDEEAKNLEFPYAEFGMTGLETAFALCRTYLSKQLSVRDLIEKTAVAPRRVFGLPQPEIKTGVRAELTVFHPDAEWVFQEKDIRSKSHNTPFAGQPFIGKVLGIINNGQAVKHS